MIVADQKANGSMSVCRLGRWSFVFSIFLLPALTACAQTTAMQGGFSAGQQMAAAGIAHGTAVSFSPSAVVAQGDVLAQELRQSVGTALLPDNPAASSRALAAAKTLLARAMTPIDRPQTLLVIDRSPAVQRLWLVIASPQGSSWPVIGSVKVSTGRPGRKEHFKTPVGVFTNTPSILGYRAQGTLNENGIRGIGQKGMRVWDFGWQTTEDWRTKGAIASVRMEMHATDPTFLESRLGRADSEACIRIPSRFNTFLDRYGLIDAQLTSLAPTNRAIAALLPKDASPSPLAGDKIVVVDTSEPDAAASDPVEAEEIQDRFAKWLAAQTPPPVVTKPSPVAVVPVQTAPTPPTASAL
jgi:hypothetical protein